MAQERENVVVKGLRKDAAKGNTNARKALEDAVASGVRAAPQAQAALNWLDAQQANA